MIARSARARPIKGRARIVATFYARVARRRDPDNALALLKPYIDGIVQAGLLADDDAGCVEYAPIVFAVDRNNPRVELRIERASSRRERAGPDAPPWDDDE